MKTARRRLRFDYNVDVTRKVVEMAHRVGRHRRGRTRLPGQRWRPAMAGEEDGIGAEGKLDHSALLTDPEEAAQFVKAYPARRAGHRHRHQPRRLQVHPQAHRRHPGDLAASRKSTSASRTRTW
jgi:hypothetical protein